MKKKDFFLQFYNFIKQQKILLFIFFLPIFVLVLILARLYFSIDLISNPLIFIFLTIEVATSFMVLFSNLTFLIQSIYLYFTTNQIFLNTFSTL
jgi:hypothetical protein